MTGTLGKQPNWLLRHRKLVLYIVAGLILALVALMITFTLMANDAATRSTQHVKDVTYSLKTNLQGFGKRAAALSVTTIADADKAIAQLDSLRTDLDHIQLPTVNAPPLASAYSPTYSAATKDLASARQQVTALKQAVDNIADFAHYGHSVAQIFEAPALSKGITDAASATACAAAWNEAKANLTKITPPTSVKTIHATLLDKTSVIAAYCQTLTDAYKKPDPTVLAQGQAELDKRIQDIRTVGVSLDTIATQLAAALNAAAAKLN